MRATGRASVSSRNPRAFGICDRCGFLYNHDRLQWQFDYAGAGLINKRILVCRPCLDTPQAQLRAIVLPADPTPIQNPRVQDYEAAETSYVTTNANPVYDPITGLPIPSTTHLLTQNGQVLTQQPIGAPDGLDPDAVMPLYEQTAYRVSVNAVSIIADGSNTITVTCSSAHGLVTNSQVAVEGLLNNGADGFYSVTVSNPMIFTYQTNNAILAGNLLQGNSTIFTALVGLPYGYTQIPQTGI